MSRNKIKLKQESFSAANGISRNKIAFSLEYLTKNKSYTFAFFDGRIRDELQARQSLSELLKNLSAETWVGIAQIGKRTQCGFETLPAVQLNFSPDGYEFSRDEKVWVFRFGSQQYRLIGIQDSNVLYVLGYDFDHSAYNHGK